MSTVDATVYTYEDWQNEKVGESSPFLNAMHSGDRFECDEEMFDYWLGVLPPAWMGRTITLDGKQVYTNFGFAEGMETVTAFWTEGKRATGLRFFGQHTDIMNPHG